MPFDDPALPRALVDPGPNPDIVPPDAPTGLAAVAANTAVSLDWDDNVESDFRHYRVYRGTATGGPYTVIASGLFDSDFVATGLTNGTPYYFVVTAVDESGNESAESSEASETPAAGGGDVTPPAAPTGLGETEGDTEVVLDWNDSGEGDLDRYGVYRATITGGPYILIGSPTASAFTATGLANGVTYYFVVTAIDTSDNESTISSQVASTPAGTADVTAPATPTGLGATPGAGFVSLNWNDNGEGDLSFYRVYRSTAAAGTFSLIAQPSASVYTDTAVGPGTTYWYKVSAVDTSGNESAQTATVNATPTVSTPGGVNIPAGASIQSFVNNNGTGTIFSLSAGNYNQTVSPKNGNVFIGALGSGGQRLTVMDGGNSIKYAFAPNVANDVTIRNIEIKNYVPDAQYAPITARTFEGTSLGMRWTVENVSSHNNSWAGIHVSEGGIVRNCVVFANAVIGVKIYWVRTTSALMEGCEIYGNNPGGAGDPFWEAGGTKFAWTKDLTARNNNVHDNDGPGLWTDIDNYGTIHENNTVINNSGIGIFHEISYSGIIRNNIVRGNGWRNRGWYWEAGICVAASQDVEVHNNTVQDNFNGIMLIQQNRGSGSQGEYIVADVNTHDNLVRGGRSGAVQQVGSNAIFTTRNNDFTNNDYVSTIFVWDNAERNFASWQGYGHDLTGSSS